MPVRHNRMAEQTIRRSLERAKIDLDWERATGAAKKWWEELEVLNRDRSHLLLRLTQALEHRRATIEDFYLACQHSGTECVKSNLRYLDTMFQDRTRPSQTDEKILTLAKTEHFLH